MSKGCCPTNYVPHDLNAHVPQSRDALTRAMAAKVANPTTLLTRFAGGASYFAKASEGHVEGLLPYYVPHARDLSPSNLPPAILGTRSAMGGKFRYRGGIQRAPEAGGVERCLILDFEFLIICSLKL